MLAPFFVTRDLDLKTNEFPGLMVVHFYVKFGDPSCISFWDIVQKKDRQTNATEDPSPTTTVCAGNNDEQQALNSQ